MANYVLSNSSATTPGAGVALAGTTTYRTQVAVCASSNMVNNPLYPSLRRGRVYDILIGAVSSAADFQYEWDLTRTTVNGSTAVWVGSLSSVSSQLALDPADQGCSAFTLQNSSAEVITAAGDVWYMGVNQRASYRWVAAPGSEFVWPATASAGFALRMRSAQGGTATMGGTVLFSE